MKVVGVTGPAGAGKSTVCRMLARRPGIGHVNLDELAHATYRPGGPAYARLLARFGEEILNPDGSVDRRRLAQLVFHDDKAREELEAIVHPAVMSALKREIRCHREGGTRWLLVEGALLLTSPHVDRSLFDAFVWLSAPEEERRRRLLAAGLPWDLVEARLRGQRGLLPPKAADVYVVDASGPPAEVADRILSLLRDFGWGVVSTRAGKPALE
ncbi:TPA: dephospho-CoA kinase [Candidatus Bipolaricaulota bacterium]|nr:dephospho-CoA kinase [Candidatus Bipolaricaulota bacterium]HIQ00380.1 dephospho-CoA kinase [Candidatus Bipolaricaulota bacterium]